MRIISKFRDYYDIGLSYGIDKNLVFVRETSQHSFYKDPPKDYSLVIPGFVAPPSIPGFKYNIKFDKTSIHDVQLFTVLFCGKLHIGLQVIRLPQDNRCRWTVPANELRHEYFYGQDKILTELNSILDEVVKSQDGKSKKSSRWNYLTGRNLDKQKAYIREIASQKGWFNDVPFDKAHGAHIKYNSPIIGVVPSEYLHDSVLTINPRLKNLSFAKAIDPYTAFQELSMFMGSLAHPEPHMVEISNEIMRDKKGFDEWSFKTRPRK